MSEPEVGRRASGDPGSRAATEALQREYYETRDVAVRDKIIAAHVGLARSLARRYADRGETLDDLVQVSMLALLKAVERFDPHRGVQFSTYATAIVLGELKRHFRDRRWGVRVPRSLQERYLKVRQVAERLYQELGRSPTVAEIAARVELTNDDVVAAMDAGRTFHVLSLDAPVDGDEDGLVMELADEEHGFNRVIARRSVAELMRRLPEREQKILRLRYAKDMTQSQIAEEVGLSQMHVSRLLAQSVEQLRQWLAEAEREAT